MRIAPPPALLCCRALSLPPGCPSPWHTIHATSIPMMRWPICKKRYGDPFCTRAISGPTVDLLPAGALSALRQIP